MTSKKHGIIFDLDGVIIDSSAVMKAAFEHAFKQFFPEQEAPFDIYAKHTGKGFLNIMREMHLPQKMYPLFYAKSIELMPVITVFEGIIPLLTALKNNDCYLGIATGKDKYRTHQILEEKNLLHFFDKIVSSDDVHQGKPNPESIHLHLQHANIEKDKMIFIGDSIADLRCAKNANINSIAALWGMGNFKELMNEIPDYIAFDMRDLHWILSLRGMLNISNSTFIWDYAS